MEMSRQRLRTGVLEASTKACPHCEGTGLMRTASSAGLSALRIIEDEAARGRGDRSCSAPGAKPRSTCSTRSAPNWPRSRRATA
jgi:ribonuclease E